MKKMIALISALGMMTALAGCNEKPAESSQAETTTAATTTAPETTEPVETTTTEVVRAAVDPNAITFEDGLLYTCTAGNDDGAAECNLEVVDYNGDKKLRVQVVSYDSEKGEYLIPKLIFDLPALLGCENVGKIDHMSVDFDCEAKDVWHNDDGTDSLVVGNFLGTLGGNIAAEKKKDADGNLIQDTWSQDDFAFQDWDHETAYFHFESPTRPLPSKRYSSDEGTTLNIMRWGQKNQVDFYIDNLTFYDKDGNSLPIIFDGSAAPAKDDASETTTAETTTAPAETTTAAETTVETTTAAAETTTAAE